MRRRKENLMICDPSTLTALTISPETEPGRKEPVTVVAITGPSAAGKTTLAHALTSRIPQAVHLQQDWFFRDPDTCPPEANFCESRWLHTEEFVAAFTALASGQTALVPQIDFQTFRRAGSHRLGPARYLIVEGMTVLRTPEIYNRCQARYYLDPGLATITERKRRRDPRERGKTPEIVEVQLGWVRREYHADRGLRADLAVTVVAPTAVEAVSGFDLDDFLGACVVDLGRTP
jgi:uridine kinase